MSEPRPPSTWRNKFRCAARGVVCGVAGQSSFLVHAPLAAAAVALGFIAELDPVRWAVLTLCIAFVVTAELLNSSLETLAPAVDRETNPLLRDALDIAAGAVLTAAIGAAVAGMMLLGPPLCRRLLHLE